MDWTATVAMSPELYQPLPVGVPVGEIIVTKNCLIQFAFSVMGFVMYTATEEELVFTSPLHFENRSLVTWAVSLDGLIAVTCTVELGVYHPLGVVVPSFWFTERRYCVS